MVFLAILLVSIFFRTYNLESWLFFQGDQTRDALLVGDAVENGPGWLPLLGPKAGGTYLRLGPIFYYFEYIAGFIFGTESPVVFVYPDLFFSILTIALLCIFLKELFPKSWSLALTLGYSVCYFAVQYSRFAWNPNSLPFFNLLFFYALFKFFNANDRKSKTLWSIVIGVAYGVVGQLHFVSFLVLPLVLVVIFIARKFYFKQCISGHLKYVGMILLVVAIFYVPVVLSDFATNGNNGLNFLNSIGKKSADFDLINLLLKNYFNFSKYSLIILSGLLNVPKNIINWSGIIMVAGLASGFLIFIKEKDEQKKFLVFLVLAWFLSYFLMYISLASKLQPRHFLVILPLPFIFLGFIALALEKSFNVKYRFIIPLVLFSVPIFANAYSVRTWFEEMGDSQTKITRPRKSPILKAVQGESWWHLKKTAQFISNDCEKEKITIIPPKGLYRTLFKYTFENIGEKREYFLKWGTIDVSDETCFYFIYFSKNDFSSSFENNIYIEKLTQKSFGDMTVLRFSLKTEKISGKTIMNNPFREDKIARSGIFPEIIEQEEIYQEEIDQEELVEDDFDTASKKGIVQKVEDIDRAERVFWKDLFN